LKYNNIKHIAVIMDGNGRWAQQRGLPRTKGHSEGVARAKEVVLAAKDAGIEFLSLYTFSKENWKRASEEVNFLMGLIVSHLKKEFDFYVKNYIKIRHVGDRDGLPDDVLEAIDQVEKDTEGYQNTTTLLLALNYSGRYDIVQAINKIISSGNKNITEKDINDFLLTNGVPDPELIIRTSGEYRLSNYYLWQASYSELIFSEKLWPDFGREDFYEAIDVFCKRDRRFGGVK